MSNLTQEEKAVFSAKFEKSFTVAGPRILIRRAPIKQDKVGAIITRRNSQQRASSKRQGYCAKDGRTVL